MNPNVGNSTRKLKSAVLLAIGGISSYGLICFYKNNDAFYKNYIMPTVRLLDPETSHNFAIFASKHRLFPKSNFKDTSQLNIKLFKKTFTNPIGIAAGFDKNAEGILGLNDIGFGFVEIGSVTPKPQLGNEKPRVFRLIEDKAVINRYGFNSDGHDKVLQRLKQIKQDNKYPDLIIGVNLGKNKESQNAIDDYCLGIKKFAEVADYFVINISSPNTPGLRQLQAKNELEKLLKEVFIINKTTANKPVLLKLAPDLTYQERIEIAKVIMKPDCRVDGLIISNTTTNRPDNLVGRDKHEIGGLSGAPLRAISTRVISHMHVLTSGTVPIIGVGGIANGLDAYDKIRAGATAVQLYTALVYDGPPVVSKVKRELLALLMRDGFRNVQQAVGADAREIFEQEQDLQRDARNAN